jgi:signal transduction histidine kinase
VKELQVTEESQIDERRRATERLPHAASANQLHELAGQLHLAREEERKRLARELHDELGQALTAIRLEIAAALSKAPAQDTFFTKKLQSATAIVDSTIRAVRRIATELRPATLELGLIPAIEWQADEFRARTGITCELRLPSQDVVLDDDRLTATFRILQEALTNVTRHSGATKTEIVLEEHHDGLFLEVRDNGRGMTPNPVGKRSLGLLGMRERALFVGGELTIQSTPGAGTLVGARIPFL